MGRHFYGFYRGTACCAREECYYGSGDSLANIAHFYAIKYPYTAQQIAQILFAEVMKLYGVPKSIVSDRDRVFISEFWQELIQMQGSTFKLCTTYHPQTNGQTKRVNQCLETYCIDFATIKHMSGLNGWHGLCTSIITHGRSLQDLPSMTFYVEDHHPLCCNMYLEQPRCK